MSLYNDRSFNVCKTQTNLKLQALRQCSEVLSNSETNLHSTQSSDMCKWQQLNVSISLFFFRIEIMTAGTLKTIQNSVIVPSCLQMRFQILRTSSSMFIDKFFFMKKRFFGWLLYIICRRWEAIFQKCFLVIGAMRYGCCAHVVEIIQKIYLQQCCRSSVCNFTKNWNSFTKTPLYEKFYNMSFLWSVFSCIWTKYEIILASLNNMQHTEICLLSFFYFFIFHTSDKP